MYIATAAPSQVMSYALPAKQQAFVCTAGQPVKIRVTFRTMDGEPVDFESLGLSYGTPGSDDSRVAAKVWEAVSGHGRSVNAKGTVHVMNAGMADITLPATIYRTPGVYTVDCGILDAANTLLVNMPCTVFVQSSAWAPKPTKLPTLQEIRHSVQQSDLLENLLRAEWIYDTCDICNALIRAVRFWNEQLPIIRLAQYTTQNFPFPSTLLTGIQLFLFQAAEEWYRRNKLQYDAGGVKVDDMAVDGDYKVAWQERFELYREEVRGHKARINLSGAYSSTGGMAIGCW